MRRTTAMLEEVSASGDAAPCASRRRDDPEPDNPPLLPDPLLLLKLVPMPPVSSLSLSLSLSSSPSPSPSLSLSLTPSASDTLLLYDPDSESELKLGPARPVRTSDGPAPALAFNLGPSAQTPDMATCPVPWVDLCAVPCTHTDGGGSSKGAAGSMPRLRNLSCGGDRRDAVLLEAEGGLTLPSSSSS